MKNTKAPLQNKFKTLYKLSRARKGMPYFSDDFKYLEENEKDYAPSSIKSSDSHDTIVVANNNNNKNLEDSLEMAAFITQTRIHAPEPHQDRTDKNILQDQTLNYDHIAGPKKKDRKPTHFRSQSCPYTTVSFGEIQPARIPISGHAIHTSNDTRLKPVCNNINYESISTVQSPNQSGKQNYLTNTDLKSSVGRSFYPDNSLSEMQIPEVDSQASSRIMEASSNRGTQNQHHKPPFAKRNPNKHQSTGPMGFVRRPSDVSRSSKSVVIHTGIIDNPPILSSMLYDSSKKQQNPSTTATKKSCLTKVSRTNLPLSPSNQQWAQRREQKYLKIQLEQQIKRYQLTQDLVKVHKQTMDINIKQSLLENLLRKNELQHKFLGFDTNQSLIIQN